MRGTTATLAQLIGSIPRQYTGAMTVGPSDGRTTTMTTSIYLLSNAPLRGTITSVSARDAQASTLYPGTTMPAQWAIQGRFEGDARAKKDQVWSGSGDAMLYVDQDKTTSPLLALGIFEQAGERAGKPFYRVVYGGEVQFMQREENKRKHITLSRVGEPAAPQYVAANTSVAAITGLPVAATPALATGSNAGAFKVPQMPQHAIAPATDEWAAMEARYARCVEIAKHSWTKLNMDDGAMVAAVATLFIEANKEHLQTAPVAGRLTQTLAVAAAVTGDPTEAQVTELRSLLNSGVFTTAERQEWLAKIYGATQFSMAQDVERLKQIITTRNPVPAGAGPGHPSSFADVPAVLERGDAADSLDDLPF